MSNHYCKEHEAVFFKKGKMRGYAHPIKDEDGDGEWHNEPEEGGDPMPEDTPMETGQYKADPAKTQSIERQSALKSAVAWCSIKVQAGQDLRSVDVIICATLFESYLTNGATVNKKEAATKE